MMKKHLNNKGWIVLNENEADSPSGIFEVMNEKLNWRLKHHDPKVAEVELEFFIFGELGNFSEDLNDIAFCETKVGNKMLNFSKINSSKWKNEYVAFIDSITS